MIKYRKIDWGTLRMNTYSPGAKLIYAFCSKRALILVTLTSILATTLIVLPRHQIAYAASGDWPTYLSYNERSGYNSIETIINPGSAPQLKMHWSYKAGSFISAQPVEANGLIYWGSWDGYEHATQLNGTQVLQQ